jgi:TIR domain
VSKKGRIFELPGNIERYIAALSKLYAQDGKRQLQEIIVNAQIRVHEEWSYNDWEGGTWGHALYLIVPESIFLRSVKKKDDAQNEIRDDINKLHNVRNEFIDMVFIEMDVADDIDWRQESGLLVGGKRDVSTDSVRRIWGDSGFRLFLSHKASAKAETAELKERLVLFGFSAFVAHADIHPTKEWQEEIENALASMDGFVALMTPDFHESDWTDQEVGYALARGVPLLSVRLGRDPYGFIGRFQGVSSDWQTAAVDIARVLIAHDRVLSAYIAALRRCPNWDSANALAKVLPALEKLTPKQIDELVAAYNDTAEVRGGWGFNGSRPGMYGPGLVHYLNLQGARRFNFFQGQIEVAQ